MTIEKYRQPVLFYGLATGVPWLFWFTAAYLSHLTPGSRIASAAGGILGVIGLMSPMAIAFYMMLKDSDLREDLFSRLIMIKSINPVYIMVTLFLMLGSILLAQAISLLFGYSANQFKIAEGFSFSYAIFPAWFMLILAPLVEELAWHSYGTDCLRARFSLFATSLMFAVYWALWHFPLSFIKDYYHSNLVEIGWIYSLNFYFSIIPFVLLMNWLYYKTDRNILVVIVFHITAGFFNEIFSTHPFSKVIQTVLLFVLTILLVIKERDFFFMQDFQNNKLILNEDYK